ncbi:alpha/beta hydrolase [Rhizobium leguminosarum bv. viciae]|nr:alpha/beta hydrolase [Rhizobium leguminosarum bv. viciae]
MNGAANLPAFGRVSHSTDFRPMTRGWGKSMGNDVIEAAKRLLSELDNIIEDKGERGALAAKIEQAIALAESESTDGPRPNLLKLIELLRSDARLRTWMESSVNAATPTTRYAPPVAKSDTQEKDLADYSVWYCTNRQPNDPANIGMGFSARRDTTRRYGECRVFVPKSHKIGSVGSPWWKRVLTLTDDRLRILEINNLEQLAYWNIAAARLARESASDQIAVVYIHGYRNSFEDATLRAAQIGFDLSIKGMMTFFSWPSLGRLEGYTADEAAIDASETAIGEYLLEVLDRSGAKTVHIVAHSMGNRGILRAIDRIARRTQGFTGRQFGQIILAAPDVDADVFRQLCSAYAQAGIRTTLYVSERDRAIEASQWLHQYARAGLMPPLMVCADIDTVNVTNSDLTMLGHGYIAQARDVLNDVHSLIFNNSAPSHRFGLKEVMTSDGERYWLIGS